MDEIQYLFSPYTERNILFNTGVARNSRLAQRIQKKNLASVTKRNMASIANLMTVREIKNERKEGVSVFRP